MSIDDEEEPLSRTDLLRLLGMFVQGQGGTYVIHRETQERFNPLACLEVARMNDSGDIILRVMLPKKRIKK